MPLPPLGQRLVLRPLRQPLPAAPSGLCGGPGALHPGSAGRGSCWRGSTRGGHRHRHHRFNARRGGPQRPAPCPTAGLPRRPRRDVRPLERPYRYPGGCGDQCPGRPLGNGLHTVRRGNLLLRVVLGEAMAHPAPQPRRAGSRFLLGRTLRLDPFLADGRQRRAPDEAQPLCGRP